MNRLTNMMRPSALDALIEFFGRFPGVGMRQAARFAYYLADENKGARAELVAAITALDRIHRCSDCFRLLNDNEQCPICLDTRRDVSRIAVLEKDANLETFEHSGAYNGHYCILGGMLSEFGDTDAVCRDRIKRLYERIKHSPQIREVILAMNATAEGNFTARYIEKILESVQKARTFKITRLGRGISTGAEIEYLNRETLKDALENRR